MANTTFKLYIDLQNNDGTGHKQAAKVVLSESGELVEALPSIAKGAAEQLFAGEVAGEFKTLFTRVCFVVTGTTSE